MQHSERVRIETHEKLQAGASVRTITITTDVAGEWVCCRALDILFSVAFKYYLEYYLVMLIFHFRRYLSMI